MVTDFGVAKAISESTGQSSLTSAGLALGTPAYMAPEQAAGDPHVDHRADIYALGALAYEMLTGRPPFVGPSPQMVLAAHVTQRPEPLSGSRAHLSSCPRRFGHALSREEAGRPVAERRGAGAAARVDGHAERGAGSDDGCARRRKIRD